MTITAYKDFVLDKEKLLYKEGEPAEFIFLIKGGEIVSVKNKDNRIIPTGIHSENDFIGCVSASLKNYHESAVTKSKAIITPIPVKDVLTVVGSCPEWVGDLLNTLSERLNASVDLMSEHKIISEPFADNYFIQNESKILKVVGE